ncbi:hypothetical protein PYCCODRAFT_580248 [Trametes coccinea BRFM310]|uniref:Uncharacterized protein n=1 Tax=Trametes coccinea (strain BRFM310) TaxID=1353009 RepID=A0A1Y2J1A6_TRAC3|nr:hypothetical protein PYCCODRAFT_580248 [Trametes coccinea BRFM310]
MFDYLAMLCLCAIVGAFATLFLPFFIRISRSLASPSISPLRHYRRLTQACHCYNSNSNSNIPDTDYWYIHQSPFSLSSSRFAWPLSPTGAWARPHTVPLLVWICSMSLSHMHYVPHACMSHHCIFQLPQKNRVCFFSSPSTGRMFEREIQHDSTAPHDWRL